MGYKIIEHTADVGIFVEADSPENIVKYSAQGMFALLVSGEISKKEKTEVILEGESSEQLLHDFLTELLYLFEVKHKVFKDFEVKFNQNSLKVLCYGEVLSDKHDIMNDIKAVTYHKFKLEKIEKKWQVNIFFDL